MPTEIAIAVVEQQGQFLIGQRPADVALGGLWEFPGGKVEPGELPVNAAVRECLEETGLVVQALGEYLIHEQAYAHDAVRLHFIRCQPGNESVAPRFPFRWVARENLPDYEFPRGNDPLLAVLVQGGG